MSIKQEVMKVPSGILMKVIELSQTASKFFKLIKTNKWPDPKKIGEQVGLKIFNDFYNYHHGRSVPKKFMAIPLNGLLKTDNGKIWFPPISPEKFALPVNCLEKNLISVLFAKDENNNWNLEILYKD